MNGARLHTISVLVEDLGELDKCTGIGRGDDPEFRPGQAEAAGEVELCRGVLDLAGA